jgi:hypothetical protein
MLFPSQVDAWTRSPMTDAVFEILRLEMSQQEAIPVEASIFQVEVVHESGDDWWPAHGGAGGVAVFFRDEG